MKAQFVKAGGIDLFISRDDGCATDVGDPPCGEPVVALLLSRGSHVSVVPKCRVHLAEVLDHHPENPWIAITEE